MTKKTRTRFAPSPTGFLHIGSARTVLFAYLFARNTGGDIFLRIDDTDRTRLVDGAIDEIFSGCDFLGIDFTNRDQPLVQSKRLEIYQKTAEKLIENGCAYHCFCSADRLKEIRETQQKNKETPKYDRKCCSLTDDEITEKLKNNEKHIIRFKFPDREIIAHDEIFGEIRRHTRDLGSDPVILKSDGFPTYHLASCVDDLEMQITHIIRSSEWLTSTPLHQLLFEEISKISPEKQEIPVFAHLPMVMSPTDPKRKLSKRHDGEEVFVSFWQKRGVLPDALVSFLARLGWDTADQREQFTREELFESFSLNRVHRSGAIFDPKKLATTNGEFIRALSPADFIKKAKNFTPTAWHDQKNFAKAAKLAQTRVQFLDELPDTLRWALDWKIED